MYLRQEEEMTFSPRVMAPMPKSGQGGTKARIETQFRSSDSSVVYLKKSSWFRKVVCVMSPEHMANSRAPSFPHLHNWPVLNMPSGLAQSTHFCRSAHTSLVFGRHQHPSHVELPAHHFQCLTAQILSQIA